MSDESLKKEALSPFERAARLVDKGSAKLSPRDVERAQRFLQAVAERVASADIKRDISQVADQLARSAGQTAPEIVATLMREPPRVRHRT